MSKEVKNELCGGNTVEQGTGNITEKAQRKNKLLKTVYCRTRFGETCGIFNRQKMVIKIIKIHQSMLE